MPYRVKQRSSISAWIAASSASTACTCSVQAAERAASVRPSRLEQRRQDEGVARLGPGVEAALERPGAAGERREGGLVGRGEVGDGGALDDADLIGAERHLEIDERAEWS